MIILTNLQSNQNRGYTRKEEKGKPVQFLGDEFSSLHLELDLQWNAEHNELVQAFLHSVNALTLASMSGKIPDSDDTGDS